MSTKHFLSFQVALSKAVLTSRPNTVEALEILGHALTRLGQHKQALIVDKKIVRLYPDNPVAFYNLACSYSNLGEVDLAFKALKKAILLGYDDIDHMKKDPDLKKLRKDKRFSGLVFNLQSKKSKVGSN